MSTQEKDQNKKKQANSGQSDPGGAGNDTEKSQKEHGVNQHQRKKYKEDK